VVVVVALMLQDMVGRLLMMMVIVDVLGNWLVVKRAGGCGWRKTHSPVVSKPKGRRTAAAVPHRSPIRFT
jgi:hypothetical protein